MEAAQGAILDVDGGWRGAVAISVSWSSTNSSDREGEQSRNGGLHLGEKKVFGRVGVGLELVEEREGDIVHYLKLLVIRRRIVCVDS